MNEKYINKLKEQINDECWKFGQLLGERDDIFVEVEFLFEVIKEGPFSFNFYYDEEEWGEELYSSYFRIWELAIDLYEYADSEEHQEIVDGIIATAINDYIALI
ncbi:hypothetical protein [Flavobacterium lindanitolerans]|jgi:hypothetical protein|uniref:hypothetical protein n=1 Tax=Flavobacterium lindanitolerans TaxID=428988 RepID=UPI0023F1F216|nr:hypothetical protein [Flavobacterium lindanitolerans]